MQDRCSPRVSQDVRRAIQQSAESLAVLAERYGINAKTVAKWKKRADTGDLPSGPRPGSSSRLTVEEEGIVVQFREHTLLPLDDCLYALQARIPHLTRSSLHRCFQRHGISRLARTVDDDVADAAPEGVAIGQVHIDKAVVHSTDGPDYLFTAIEQVSKFVVVQIMAGDGEGEAAKFLGDLIAAVPFRMDRVHTIDAAPFTSAHGQTPFSRLCGEHGIEHHLRSSLHPGPGGNAHGVGRMIQQDIVFASRTYLAGMLRDFVYAYNYRRRLKTLRGRTPFEFLRLAWEREPDRFARRPHHEVMGPEIATG